MESVRSVMEQSLPSKNDIFIVDDGSFHSDTLFTLYFLSKVPGIKVVHLKGNQGTSAALNYGHENIKSEYIALQGSDDVSHQDRFRRQVVYLERNPGIDVLGTNLSLFYDSDPKRKVFFTTKHVEKPLPGKGWQTNHGTVFYRNQAVMDVGGYDLKLRRAQDVELWKRMLEAGKVFRNLSDTLYLWRRFKK